MSSDSTGNLPDEGLDRVLVVEIGGRACGLPGPAVREIVGILPATRLPGAPPHVAGVVNLRGQLLTVVDLRRRLTGTPVGAADGAMVVIQSGDRCLGVLVDDVREVQPMEVVAADRQALAGAEGLVTGLGRLGDEVVLVIDVPELVRQTLA